MVGKGVTGVVYRCCLHCVGTETHGWSAQLRCPAAVPVAAFRRHVAGCVQQVSFEVLGGKG